MGSISTLPFDMGIAALAAARKEHKYNMNRHTMQTVSNVSELPHGISQKAIGHFFSGDTKTANSILEARKIIKIEEERLMKELLKIPHLRATIFI